MAIPVEVVVSTLSDIEAAAEGGANRVELCVDLACGGLTPGRSLVQAAVRLCHASNLGLRVLIRPRTGDFVLDEAERRLVLEEADAVLSLGAEKVVVGGLDENGEPDGRLLEALADSVGLASVVFHRALDEAEDYPRALQALNMAGVQEVLTSGGQSRAVDGCIGLKAASEHFKVVAGSGVRADQVPTLLSTGVHAIHASCRSEKRAQRPGRWFETARSVVDVNQVRELVQAVRALDRP